MFKTQIARIDTDRIIKDKNDKSKILKFNVITFTEYDLKTGIPTGKFREKWYQVESENDFTKLLKNIELKIGNFVKLELDISGNIVSLTPWKDK